MSEETQLTCLKSLNWQVLIDSTVMIEETQLTCLNRLNLHIWRDSTHMFEKTQLACLKRLNWHVWRDSTYICEETKITYWRDSIYTLKSLFVMINYFNEDFSSIFDLRSCLLVKLEIYSDLLKHVVLTLIALTEQ